MKKAQVVLEYVLFFLILTVVCIMIMYLWNRSAVIRGATFGVEDEHGTVNVRAFDE